MNKNMVISIGITAIVAGAIAYAVIPKKEAITVKLFTRKREVDIEEYKEVEESEWDVPIEATVTHVSTRSKMETDISTNGVKDIVRYRPYYIYKIKRWVMVDTYLSDSSMSEVPFYDDKDTFPEGR